MAFKKTLFVNCIEHHTKLSIGDITKGTTFKPNVLYFPNPLKKSEFHDTYMKVQYSLYKCKMSKLCVYDKMTIDERFIPLLNSYAHPFTTTCVFLLF